MLKINSNSIFFLYEGDTEKEFYSIIFKKHLSNRKIRLSYNNLKGITTDINKKIEGKIHDHIRNPDHQDRLKIHVFIAIDREGTRKSEPLLDIEALNKKFIKPRSRIISINSIIATQDFESWLFHDIEGICKFLKAPLTSNTFKKYSNVEKTNNRILAHFFREHGRTYFKGTRVQNFIETLDLDKIYKKCKDLREGVEKMKKLTTLK
jgi:hypothetical protein